MLEKILKQAGKLFQPGKPLAKLFPVYEALDTFALTPGTKTKTAPLVRDAIDIKRVMSFVIVALLPCIVIGIYNVGWQMIALSGGVPALGACFAAGLKKVLPITLVTYMAGGFWEVLFAVTRKHEINEGFLVTGMLFALIMPPTVPLWMVAVGISFGVVIGKEIFGGAGYNGLNPALTGRAFLYFSYPVAFSGNAVYVALDGVSRATPLAVVSDMARGGDSVAALAQEGYSLGNMFWGLIPGVIGETSAFACLLGLAFLLITGIASWRIVTGCAAGLLATSTLFWLIQGPQSLGAFSLPPHYHLVMGGFAFGAIFMATDPVSASATNVGRWIYGICIGVLTVLIRVINPAYPEGVMLAILFMNVFAPLIDHFVVEGHIRRKNKRVKGKAV